MQTASNPLGLEVTLKEATGLVPRHDFYDVAKVDHLAAAMASDGWQGAPIVIDTVAAQAITGSHRIAAATRVGEVEVPVVDICALADAAGVDLDGLIDTYNTLEDALPAFCAAVPPWVAEAYGLDID